MDTSARTKGEAQVDLWIDPGCPYSWNASRWLLEAGARRTFAARLHVMSVRISHETPNETTDLSPNHVGHLPHTVGPPRVATAVLERYGQDVLWDFYTAFGERVFDRARFVEHDEYHRAMRAALEEVGLPIGLVATGDAATYDEALRRSHDAGVLPVGGHTGGTPTIHLDGVAFFGPVLNVVPRGDAAARFLDALLVLAHTPGFHELKRDRTGLPSFG